MKCFWAPRQTFWGFTVSKQITFAGRAFKQTFFVKYKSTLEMSSEMLFLRRTFCSISGKNLSICRTFRVLLLTYPRMTNNKTIVAAYWRHVSVNIQCSEQKVEEYFKQHRHSPLQSLRQMSSCTLLFLCLHSLSLYQRKTPMSNNQQHSCHNKYEFKSWYTLTQKRNSSPFHLQILKWPEGAQEWVMSHFYDKN